MGSRRIEIENIVRELGEFLLFNNEIPEFKKLARERAEAITRDDIEILHALFHRAPESPLYNPEVHGLGGWISRSQFAIFELIYNLKAEALPFLRKIAWGEYDWTQGNAIEILIRLASEGINRESIIKEIKKNFPEIRYEAQLYSVQPLIGELDSNKDLEDIFCELLEIEEFQDAYEELTE